MGIALARLRPLVLIVDNDDLTVELLAKVLKHEGFVVHSAAGGTAGLRRARALRPDVILLEVNLPHMDGFTMLRRLRVKDINAPVVFLSASAAVADKVKGLTMGGDDYITKPFSPEEVSARLWVMLRRGDAKKAVNTRVRFADIELDLDTREAWKAQDQVQLTPTEFTLLHYFMSNPGKVLSKRIIKEHIWPVEFNGHGDNTVEAYVSYLRRKIDTGNPKLLQTLRGVGYVLRAPEASRQ